MIVNNPYLNANSTAPSNNPLVGNSVPAAAPTSISEVTRSNSKRMVNDAQSNLDRQSSTIVNLSTQGQLMSRSDRAGSTGESNESSSQESSESTSIQFQEGEMKGSSASATYAPTYSSAALVATYTSASYAPPAPRNTAPAISSYMKVAAL